MPSARQPSCDCLTASNRMEIGSIRSKTGRPLGGLTLESVLAGEVTPADLNIGAETLRRQAEAVEAAGYRHVARNLRRAAELTLLTNEEVLEIYRALRPGRANHAELLAIADRLETEYGAPLTANLIREAAEVYLTRGIIA
jgi:propanediol dehydratase small subunit